MKILLVKPSPRLKTIKTLHRLLLLEPLELGYIAASVPQQHEVKILDLRLAMLPDLKYKKEIQNFKPDVIGISGYTHEASLVKEMARTAKKLLPKVIVVVGGHHATVLPKDYDIESIDLIVRGEGCTPFSEIIKRLESDKNLSDIPNVLLTGKGFNEDSAKQMPVYPDLSTVPNPRRDFWDYRQYRCIWVTLDHPAWQTIFPNVALVRSSFGCVMNCSFCVVPRLCGRKHLKRDPKKVAEEIAQLKPEHIYFCDDETFLDEEHARNVAFAIKEMKINKKYFAWARSTTVNKYPELFKLWKNVGLDGVFLGFEAISDADLDKLSKHSSVYENENAHKILTDLGIAVQVGFMVRPDFSKNDFENLIQYVKKMPPTQITFTVYTPSPGSPAWFEEKNNFWCNPYKLHDCIHPLSKTNVSLVEFYKYFSKLVNLGGLKNPLRSPKTRLKPKDIIKIIYATTTYTRSLKKAYKDF